MKVYLDENLSPQIAGILRQRAVDAVSAHEAGKRHLDDRVQLAYATGEGRAIVTGNVVDFLALATEAVRENRGHAGIILVPPTFSGREFDAIAAGILQVLRACPTGLRDLVVYVQRGMP